MAPQNNCLFPFEQENIFGILLESSESMDMSVSNFIQLIDSHSKPYQCKKETHEDRKREYFLPIPRKSHRRFWDPGLENSLRMPHKKYEKLQTVYLYWLVGSTTMKHASQPFGDTNLRK